MNLDDQLAELLARLGVLLEEPEDASAPPAPPRFTYGARSPRAWDSAAQADELAAAIQAPAEMSLFQTSREHYGVFYRLDLAAGLPQVRIFLPDEENALKMRCYLVRAAAGTPLCEWFLTTREHNGSPAYEDARDSAQQHLLFAAGELMKRLFWTGNVERQDFPPEIDVLQLA